MFGIQRHLWIDGAAVSAYRDDGTNVGFTKAPSSSGGRHADGYALQPIASGYELRTPGNVVERYDAAGRLVSAHDLSGRFVTVTHDALGRIAAVTASSGRQLRFEYSTPAQSGAPGVLRAAVLPDGGRVEYDIDAQTGWLNGVTYPDGTSRRYAYITQGSDTMPLLVSVTDEAGGRSAYTYEDGVATSTTMPGGVGTWSLAQQRSVWGDGVSTLTGPNGAQYRVTLAYQSGRLVVASSSQPAGSGCAAATAARVHDSRGNIVQEDDLDGARTCRAFETLRNLPTVRVEGLPSAGTGSACSAVLTPGSLLPEGSRKVTTEWHPEWRLARRVAEPRRLTLTVHHGQPDPTQDNAIARCAPAGAVLPGGQPLPLVCKEVQWATTDPSGAAGFAASVDASVPARQQAWTYDTQGRRLTWTDWAGQTTRYAHQQVPGAGLWPGDLLSETNALGHAVHYTGYAAGGQWLGRVDANGFATRRRFDARERLVEETRAGRTTRYAWTATGRLERLTLPDGSWVAYEYDAAQRLEAISDSAGRRISYGLDAAGNRVAEAARDATGALHRAVERRFDALGRAERQTGLELLP
jgi:YD repeat-containing protein